MNYSRYVSGEAFGAWAKKQRICPPYDPRTPSTGQCTGGCPCDVAQGDCDNSTDCRTGLACAHDVGAKYGLPADYDVCEAPSSCPNTASTTFCKDPSCPCSYGQGDCDDDYECGGSLVCRNHIGASVGLPSDYDLCVYATDPGCTKFDASLPSTTFCSSSCPCDLGEGIVTGRRTADQALSAKITWAQAMACPQTTTFA